MGRPVPESFEDPPQLPQAWELERLKAGVCPGEFHSGPGRKGFQKSFNNPSYSLKPLDLKPSSPQTLKPLGVQHLSTLKPSGLQNLSTLKPGNRALPWWPCFFPIYFFPRSLAGSSDAGRQERLAALRGDGQTHGDRTPPGGPKGPMPAAPFSDSTDRSAAKKGGGGKTRERMRTHAKAMPSNSSSLSWGIQV